MANSKKCEICGNSNFDYESWEFDMMEKQGYYVHAVEDAVFPTGYNIHTHGILETFSHPDIQIVMPLDHKTASGVLASAVKIIKDGNMFESGKKYSKILNGYDVTFFETKDGGRNILRMILPDVKGNLDKGTFKGDINFDSEYYDLQYEG